jgi:hypothetical protein
MGINMETGSEGDGWRERKVEAAARNGARPREGHVACHARARALPADNKQK